MDSEKVIKEWETVLSRDPLDAPYDLIDDTLTLLKEQEEETQNLRRENHNILTQFHEWAKEQEAVEPDTDSEGICSCGNCGETVGYYPVGCNVPERLCKFCPECGKAVQWDDCV